MKSGFYSKERMNYMNMNEKLYAIKKSLMKNGRVHLVKQCKQEYIIYFFSMNYERNCIISQTKQYFKNKDLKCGKTKRKKVNIAIEKFIDDVAYDLLNRGYELENFKD